MIDLDTQISDSALRGYELLRDDSGLVDLPHLALLTLSGEDRKGWLQGQATSDVRKLEPGASSVFCLTAITGHLMSVCEAWAVSDRILVTCPVLTAANVLKRVEQMVIMEDVVAEEVTGRYRLMSIQGPTATARLSQLLSLPNLDAGIAEFEGASIYVLRSNRTGLGGWDLWVSIEDTTAVNVIRENFFPVSQESYDIARLEAGIPLFGSDMGEKTFPPEMGKAFEERHVSYNKGCYMGQEVLMRIHSRGHTNKTWVGLLSESPLEVGATVSQNRRSDAGTVTSAAFSPDFGYIGAAMIRNDFAFDGETVQVLTAKGTVDAEVRLMPILR
jgi:folate-binding protein YgfZ